MAGHFSTIFRSFAGLHADISIAPFWLGLAAMPFGGTFFFLLKALL